MDNDTILGESTISPTVELTSAIDQLIEGTSTFITEIADESTIYQTIELCSQLELACN